jgi:tetratricopeptide (TPR) repeat protein
MLRPLALVLVLVPFLSLAAPALAQDHEPTDAELAEARHSFDVATHAFETGDYETAVSEFRAALELSGAADLYFNIYLSEEREGNLPEAADALDQYLQHGTIEPEQRTLLTGRLERLRARIAAHTPAPAAEERQELHASPIASQPEASPEPPAEPTPAPTPTPIVSTSPPAVAIALIAVAGVLAINFGVFAGLAFAENDRLNGACGHGCLSSQVATLNNYDIVADVSWIGAAVIGATGLVLLFALPADTHEEGPSIAVSPWVSPIGAGLSARGTF